MRQWLNALDHCFDAAFGASANPLKQLGALAFLLFWLMAVSGVLLYVLLDTSAAGAWHSIERLHEAPWRTGDALRGLHRYAADAFAVVVLAHLLREAWLGRFNRWHRHAWWTGVVLLPVIGACAIGGFWLNWDRLGQYSAIATAEWLDALLGTPTARNFLAGGVSDRLFSLFVFVHLGLPLLLVFGAWAHVQRLGHPAVFPRRALAIGTTLTLLVLAFALPVSSQGPADVATVPQQVAIDWLLLFLHPLVDHTSAGAVWALLAGSLALLLALPLWQLGTRPPAAQVDPAHCSGCGRCVSDCPYAAISLVPHPLHRGAVILPQVRAAQCAGCGLCVAACPSSTPFRKTLLLTPGIDLPQRPMAQLRKQLSEGLASGRHRVVFGCDCGADVTRLAEPGVLALSLPCAGMLPPSFVEYALRQGASSVLVTGCRDGGCDYRLGRRWAAERLDGAREPHLRPLPAGAWNWMEADMGEEQRVSAALRAMGKRA
jgi:ferredoxin